MSAGVPPEVFVGDLAAIRRRLVEDVRREAGQRLAAQGQFSLAVPGGSVALHVLPVLASLALDWSRTHVFWVDERVVPREDSESNFGVVHNGWLGPARAPAAAMHPMPVDRTDLGGAAEAYDSEIRRVLGARPRLDYVLLGVGPDGHVASLFPGHPALEETARLAVPVVDAPKPPPRRLSLAMPMLVGAGRVVVIALGASKADAVAEALEHHASALPVSTVARRAGRVLLLLDPEAAGRHARP